MSPINTLSTPSAKKWTPPAALAGPEKIAAINDHFRKNYGDPAAACVPGRMVITRGIANLDPFLQFAIIRAVRAFDDFDAGDDPHGHHDFGAMSIDGLDERIFWKIDVYADDSFEWGAEDAGDIEASYRVLTVFFASEY